MLLADRQACAPAHPRAPRRRSSAPPTHGRRGAWRDLRGRVAAPRERRHIAPPQVPVRQRRRPPSSIARPDLRQGSQLPQRDRRPPQESAARRRDRPEPRRCRYTARAHMTVVAAALVAMGVVLRLTVEDAHHPAMQRCRGKLSSYSDRPQRGFKVDQLGVKESARLKNPHRQAQRLRTAGRREMESDAPVLTRAGAAALMSRSCRDIRRPAGRCGPGRSLPPNRFPNNASVRGSRTVRRAGRTPRARRPCSLARTAPLPLQSFTIVCKKCCGWAPGVVYAAPVTGSLSQPRGGIAAQAPPAAFERTQASTNCRPRRPSSAVAQIDPGSQPRLRAATIALAASE
jgi:hypothetical protein